MHRQVSDEDRELLDELGVDIEPEHAKKYTAKEERVIAGFEEIQRFVEEHDKLPQHGEGKDIFERMYAVRLDQLRKSKEFRKLLTGIDSRGLLKAESPSDNGSSIDENLSDEALLASLGVEEAAKNDITKLTHVRPRQEINAAEEVAQRTPCEDFDKFKPIFDSVQNDLEVGERKTKKYQDNAAISKGDLFILDGQKVIVADMGKKFISDYGRPDRRLRVVYDNATESDLLLRSLQRALNKDKTSRRITKVGYGSLPLFADRVSDADFETGNIYVLRSKSDNPFIAENRSVIHKIGVTSGNVENRIYNAKKDPTYLMADVEVVATFKLANINGKRLEALLKKFFSNARLDLKINDRFDLPVKPKEWFLVPLNVIEEAIEKIKKGTLDQFHYDPDTATLVKE